MTIKNFIQLVEQADIPNMQIIGQLGDGFANIRYNGMAGVLDQQSNKMILISQKIPDAYQIVTVTGGREMTDYVGGDQIGPATKKALDSISPRQRPRPPAPLPSQESYESTEQVRSIVQRMMEDARVPQKPRQGPLRPQTGAGKHKDKKKDQKQGKEKHKGKNLDENSIPFAGLGKHKIGQAGQLRSPGPTGYPKGKLVGGAAESRFGRNRDDQFSLGGRMPRTDRIDRDGPNDQDFSNKMRQQTINRLLDKYPNLTSASFKGKSLPELIQMLREAVKKPNATTRHLRDYPVSDKDVAKPVKKPEKKKPEQGVAEGLPQILRKFVPGHAKREIDKKMDAGKFGKTDADKDANFQRYKKIQDKLKEQGVAEGSSYQTDSMVSHISQIITDIYPQGGDKNTYMKLVARKMPRIVKNDPKLFRRAFGIAYDKFFHIDQDDDDDFDYTDYSMRQGERGMAEEKQKGVDGKACWKGYKRMGTKKKGGRTVDNCVKMESISEGILQSFGLKEVSPPGFKGTVKAMKKHPELTKGKTKDGKEKNPWALAWHMKNKGYKSHKKADGSDKD